MKSYSSNFEFKKVNVVENASLNKPHKLQNVYSRLCGNVSCSQISMSSSEKAKRYFARIYKFRHMDFEYALWQMVNIFVAPQKLYRNFSYNSSTRNQWARDDPAFLILMMPWIFVSTIIFSVILHLNFLGWFRLLMWSIFVECIISGLAVSTLLWIITNRWMIKPDHSKRLLRRRRFSVASSDDSISEEGELVQPDVEWAYAFDIHLNALFPCIVMLRIIQTPFLFFIRKNLILSCLLGNSFWLTATLFYVYITFLGYKALPFLKFSRAILISGTVLVILFVVSIPLNWNFTAGVCRFYATF